MATLILKVTERCNSNCAYCDVVRKQESGATMSLEMLETVFRRVGEYLAARPEDSVELVWHGGEPLLPGPGHYRAVVELQERYCGGRAARIHHSIQTNLTLFDEEFVEVFGKLGITSVGSSYDPEPHVRGPGAERDTDSYNRRFMRGVRVLERHGMGWGVIYVVTKKSLADPVGVFSYLTNMLLTGGINFNPVLIYDEERRELAVSPGEYVEFLGAIFPLWWKHRDRYPSISPFKPLVDCIVEHKTTLSCAESGTCTFRHINIAPDGSTSHCGRSADWQLLSYGNIADRTVEEILGDSQRGQLAERVERIRGTDCAGCRFWEICHGGCPLDSWSQHRDFLHKSEWCEARRGFIEKYFEPITGVRYEPRTA